MGDRIPEFDLYAELGVQPGADDDQIDAAWRERVRAAHPDRSYGDSSRAATVRTARLNVARAWLTDPEKRDLYDRLRLSQPYVELPAIDPLGRWPGRLASTGRLRRTPALIIRAIIAVAFVVLLVTLGVGVSSNYATVIAFSLSALILAFYGLLGVLTLLRRLGPQR